ncbi:hypothetical protein PROFUN_01366 [Planoprotostelium fungivorum]|uniref:Uncharacterized protein n=1 Tax=Planoprotostelium fungivorum TaxID=1890364 RepID=A0A2P6NZV1_9EUKA|nr:hypothetical protein PROFUN_01366 [Planoprotostelium fungivorum]
MCFVWNFRIEDFVRPRLWAVGAIYIWIAPDVSILELLGPKVLHQESHFSRSLEQVLRRYLLSHLRNEHQIGDYSVEDPSSTPLLFLANFASVEDGSPIEHESSRQTHLKESRV